MSTPRRLPRSPHMMDRTETGLLVVDVQEKLVPHIHERDRILWNIRRLVEGAAAMGVELAGTEQYPRGLGATVPGLRERLPAMPEKVVFSCGACPQIFEAWQGKGIGKVLIAGIETHVCVAQTAFDLLEDGWAVYLAIDATGSRHEQDRDVALRRMEGEGVTLTTTEAALFEWCDQAGTAEFKLVSRLVREEAPGGEP